MMVDSSHVGDSCKSNTDYGLADVLASVTTKKETEPQR